MTPTPGRFATGLVFLLASAHFVHDVFTAFLAPILPLLIEKLNLTLFQAGSLAVMTQIPSFFNPLLGSWVDRNNRHRLFVAIGPAGSGTMMCLLGVAPSYAAIAILLLTAGVSVACLHVSAPVMIQRVAADRVGRGMSFFMVAGELARTVGPLVAVQLVATWGLAGLWRAIPVALASSALLWWRLGEDDVKRPQKTPLHLFAVWSQMRGVLAGVTGILISRAFMAGALVAGELARTVGPLVAVQENSSRRPDCQARERARGITARWQAPSRTLLQGQAETGPEEARTQAGV